MYTSTPISVIATVLYETKSTGFYYIPTKLGECICSTTETVHCRYKMHFLLFYVIFVLFVFTFVIKVVGFVLLMS